MLVTWLRLLAAAIWTLSFLLTSNGSSVPNDAEFRTIQLSVRVITPVLPTPQSATISSTHSAASSKSAPKIARASPYDPRSPSHHAPQSHHAQDQYPSPFSGRTNALVRWGEPQAIPPVPSPKLGQRTRAFVLQGNVSLNPANGDAWQSSESFHT